jgi:hypothetical protein
MARKEGGEHILMSNFLPIKSLLKISESEKKNLY